MKQIKSAEFEHLAADALVLAEDSHGLKVLLTPSGDILKLFRVKRIWSSARLWPYARRFERNARALNAMGIRSVEVRTVCKIKGMQRDLVVYRELAGRSLRETLSDPVMAEQMKSACLQDFAALLARLHRHGVLFRSIHFGNVLVQPDSSFALIDVSDLRRKAFGALNPWQRARNFRHMLRYAEDRQAMRHFGVETFIQTYLSQATELSPVGQKIFNRAMVSIRRMIEH